MARANRIFVAAVLLSLALGGLAGADYAGELGAIEDITVVERQLESTVTELRLEGGALEFAVVIENPTTHAVELHGTFVRIFEGRPEQLAYGAGERVDDGRRTVPAHGHLRGEYRLPLSPEQEDRLRQAFRAGPVRVSVFHSLSMRGEPFRVARTNITVEGAVID